MRIATWNVNSLKARLEKVTWWLERARPDVLLMQETKLADDDVPADAFRAAGYELAHHGAGRWNGVAVASRVGVSDGVTNFGLPRRDARVAARARGVRAAVRLGAGRRLPAPSLGARALHLVGLPRRQLPQELRDADRSPARERAGRQTCRGGGDRPRGAQGQAGAVGSRAAGDRPRPAGPGVRRRMEDRKSVG